MIRQTRPGVPVMPTLRSSDSPIVDDIREAFAASPAAKKLKRRGGRHPNSPWGQPKKP